MPALDLHALPLGPDGEPCATCGAPLAADQRYCLECGMRRGPARLDPVAMARSAWALPAPMPMAPARVPRRGAAWTMPSPRVAATAAMAVLAFGIVAGTVAGPRADTSLASAAAGPVVLVGPAPAAPIRAPVPAPPPPAAPPETPAPDASAPADAGEAPAAATPATRAPSSRAPAPAPSPDAQAPPAAPTTAPPPVKHVWLVALTGHSLDEVGAAPGLMPYLSGTLRPKGLLLPEWEASSAGSLANLVVLTSGQKPTYAQKQGCPTYANTTCVLPARVDTVMGQLTAQGKTWRGYVEGADAGPNPADTCRRPQLGRPDPWTAPRPGDAYLTQRDPFVYYHSIVDAPDCAGNIAGISRLAPDAQDAESAPNLSLVVPDACHDGRDTPCADGAPAGLGAADAWLKAQIDPLLASKAYADDGMVVITFDAGPDPLKPVGALVLSPHVEPGGTSGTPYTHTGLLKTIEDAFSLPHLGKAKSRGVKALGNDVFSVTTPSP
ncbi:MAG: alkaline phosphatase family protein [Solirubrobacteraceae bacterium]